MQKGLEGMWKEAVVAGFEALSQHVRRDRGKPHTKLMIVGARHKI